MKATWVVVGLVVVAATVGTATQSEESVCPVEIEDSGEPGQELANVVGAQESVVARELERRGFNATLANASNPSERATVVATEIERIDARVTELEACREALIDAREGEDLSAEEYRQRVGTLEPEIDDVSERLDRAAEAADALSPRVRERNDVDEERFERLESRVDDLEAFVERPGRAIESVSNAGDADTPAEPSDDAPTEPTFDGTPTGPSTTAEPTDSDDEDETPTPTPDDTGQTGVDFGEK